MDEIKAVGTQGNGTPVSKGFPFLVEELLSLGVTLLCGCEKIGKSWLALLLALTIARGKLLWDCIPTTRCGVLYFCLNDSEAHMEGRIEKLMDTAPGNLRFVEECDIIGAGLHEQVVQQLREHPDIGLVVIDSYPDIRIIDKDVDKFGNEYNNTAALRRLARKENIGILLLDMAPEKRNSLRYESNGLTAAADTVLRLEPAEHADEAWLFVTGRDVPNQVLTLRMEDCVWRLVSRNAKTVAENVPPFLHRLLGFMADKHRWEGSASELLEAMGETKVTASYVTRYIKQYAQTVLEPEGIFFQSSRTGEARKLVLDRREPHNRTGDGMTA